jgi:hypothetical protein
VDAIRAAVATVCLLAALPACAENWASLGSNVTASAAVDMDSVRPAEGMPDRLGAWVRYTYPMSIDCAPPRGCRASSQRVYVLVNCAAQGVAYVQRISYDLNGNVVGQTDANLNATQSLARPGSAEGELWRAFCPAYPDRFERP